MPGSPQGSMPVAVKWPLAWAIFLAEGHCKASVPFGWLPLKRAWKEGKASFWAILRAVAGELELEWHRWVSGQGYPEGDFITHLARKGYNANPKEWDTWERNVRFFFKALTGQDRIEKPRA